MSSYKKKNQGKKGEEKNNSFILITLLVIFAAVIFGYGEYLNPSNYETTNEAVIEGKLMTVSPKVAGTVIHLYVEDSQEVKKGDLLLEIDPSFYETRLRKAETELKSLKTKLYMNEYGSNNNNSNSVQPDEQKKSVFSRLNLSKSSFSHYEKMFDEEITSAQEYERQKELLAEKQANEKKENINPKDNTEDTEEELTPEMLASEIKRLEAEVEQAKLDLSCTKVYAPQDGIISAQNVRESDYVEVGQTMLSIIPKRVWVLATFREHQLVNMREGQPVFVKIKKYPHRRFKAVVDNIQRTSNTKPEFNSDINMLQKVPVRITFTEDYSDFDIPPSTTAEVKVKIK